MEQKEKGQDQIQTKSPYFKGKLRIVHISDTHGKHKYVTIPECDILICSGDISMLGQKHEVESFIAWFKRQYRATYRVFVAGNHDITFDPNKSGERCKPRWLWDIINEFREDENNIYLENESREILGLTVWGSPYSSWFHGEKWAFNVHRGADSHALYSTIPLGVDIVINHDPPYGKNDWCRDVSGPVGNEELRKHIKRVKPLLFLSGHIHESYGYTYDENTHYFNGAICDLRYEPANKPWLIEADFDEKEVKILNNEKS